MTAVAAAAEAGAAVAWVMEMGRWMVRRPPPPPRGRNNGPVAVSDERAEAGPIRYLPFADGANMEDRWRMHKAERSCASRRCVITAL